MQPFNDYKTIYNKSLFNFYRVFYNNNNNIKTINPKPCYNKVIPCYLSLYII